MAKVAISNGHGLKTPGKRTPRMPDGKVIHEWEFNYPTAKKLEAILKNHGVITLMVSDTSNDTSLNARVSKSNNWSADIYISIHFNAFKSIWGNHGGVESLYFGKSTEGKKLAKLIQDNLIKDTKLRNRGIKVRNDLYELNSTKAVAVIAECGFMDNLAEAKLMLDPKFQQTCAEAIAKGVLSYLGIPYKPGKPSQPNPPSQPNKKSNDTVANEVLLGRWGNGKERVDRLTKAGYNAKIIQDIVDKTKNKPVTPKRKPNETIAREVIAGKWGNGKDRINRLTKAGYNYNAIRTLVNKLI